MTKIKIVSLPKTSNKGRSKEIRKTILGLELWAFRKEKGKFLVKISHFLNLIKKKNPNIYEHVTEGGRFPIITHVVRINEEYCEII